MKMKEGKKRRMKMVWRLMLRSSQREGNIAPEDIGYALCILPGVVYVRSLVIP
jgi:hypothetical protein